MSDMVMMKVADAKGGVVVYDVQPQHVGRMEWVVANGRKLFARMTPTEGWLSYLQGAAAPVTKAQAFVLDSLPVDFLQPG